MKKEKKVRHDSRGFIVFEEGELPKDMDSESEEFKKLFPLDKTPQERASRLKGIREAHESFEEYKRRLPLIPQYEKEKEESSETEKEEIIEPYSKYEEEKKYPTKIDKLAPNEREYVKRLVKDSLKEKLPSSTEKEQYEPMSLRQVKIHLERYHNIKLSYSTLKKYREKIAQESKTLLS